MSHTNILFYEKLKRIIIQKNLMNIKQIILSLLLLSGFSCNAPLEPELLIPCDCSKVKTIGPEQEAEGILLFPTNTNYTYSIYSRSFGRHILVCSDSLFISSIKKNKITDSTRVYFRHTPILEKVKCLGLNNIAMKIIDLKKL
jgi:hypothetical protein